MCRSRGEKISHHFGGNAIRPNPSRTKHFDPLYQRLLTPTPIAIATNVPLTVATLAAS